MDSNVGDEGVPGGLGSCVTYDEISLMDSSREMDGRLDPAGEREYKETSEEESLILLG